MLYVCHCPDVLSWKEANERNTDLQFRLTVGLRKIGGKVQYHA